MIQNVWISYALIGFGAYLGVGLGWECAKLGNALLNRSTART